MGIYRYTAKKGPKNIISETMEAESSEEVVNKLTQQGYFPVKIEPLVGLKERSKRTSAIFANIRMRDVNIFTRQMASLIKAGVPLLKALNVILAQTEKQTLKNIISQIASEVKDGKTFSESLRSYPNIFPSLYISLIKSGEDSGTLDNVLIRLADHREKMEQIRSHVRSALIYPSLIVVVGILTVVVMMAFVVPQLRSVFTTMGQGLPLSTELLLAISDALRNYWLFILIGLLGFVVIIRVFLVVEKTAFDEAKLRFPVIGNFIRKSELGKFNRTLGLLINNGIPILTALEITIPTLGNLVLQRKLKEVTEGLKSGISFSAGLNRTTGKHFPPFMINLIAVGEEGGQLGNTLDEIAGSYERETEEMIKIGLSLLEPVLILITGLVVGFIVVSILLPIFTMGTMVG
jgi:type II secretory pathway component PulF